MEPPRDYINGTEPNKSELGERERERVRENENGASLRKSFIVSCFNWLWLREIVQEGVNKSNQPIQNPLLLVTELRTRDNNLRLCNVLMLNNTLLRLKIA
jgi:hypothetical protein